MLYEMLAGHPPFGGAPSQDLLHQHLAAQAPALVTMRPDVPNHVATAVARCLAKNPEARFPGAREFTESLAHPAQAAVQAKPLQWIIGGVAAALLLAMVALVTIGRDSPFARWLRGQPPAGDTVKRSWILVADFEGSDTSPSLADAVHDLMISAIDQSEIVQTITRDQISQALGAMGQPAGTRLTPSLALEVAARNSVGAVVEGRISRLENGYVTLLQVVDARSRQAILTASETADDEDALIPSLHRLSGRLRRGLGERASAIRASRPLSQVTTASFDAYQRFDVGKRLAEKGDYEAAVAAYRDALAADPGFAEAWLNLGIVEGNLGNTERAVAAFGEAARNPGRLTDALQATLRVRSAQLAGDLRGALVACDRYLERRPNDYLMQHRRGLVLLLAGRYTEGLEATRKAAELTPFGPLHAMIWNQFVVLADLGRYREAKTMAARLKGGHRAYAELALTVAAGDRAPAESLAANLEQAEATPPWVRSLAFVAGASAAATRGEVRRAFRAIEEAQREAQRAEREDILYTTQLARICLLFASGDRLRPPRPDVPSDTTMQSLIVNGLAAVETTDLAQARRLLKKIQARPFQDLTMEASGPVVLEAAIAAREKDWQKVERVLHPAARNGARLGDFVDPTAKLTMRLLLARAYEGLSRPDSAAAYYHLVLTPTAGMNCYEMVQYGLACSFAQRRLAEISAATGRADEAERHWRLFVDRFTRPDPELRDLLRRGAPPGGGLPD